MKKTIIFDLDGTLLNTLEDLTNSTNFALNYFNYPKRNINEIRNFVGDGVAKLIERAIPEGINNKNYKKCLEIFKQHYSQNMNKYTVPFEGIKELLTILKRNNYKIAVVSNKFDDAVKELCNKYFPNLIDIAIGENEISGIRKKPASDMMKKIFDDLNITINDAIYVGDSDVDILTARNTKIPCVCVTWGYRSREFLIKNGAKILVDKPSEILKHLG